MVQRHRPSSDYWNSLPIEKRLEMMTRARDSAWEDRTKWMRRAEAAETEPSGYHGSSEFDLHYDPRCERCIAQRDRLRPEPEFDEIYATTDDEGSF